MHYFAFFMIFLLCVSRGETAHQPGSGEPPFGYPLHPVRPNGLAHGHIPLEWVGNTRSTLPRPRLPGAWYDFSNLVRGAPAPRNSFLGVPYPFRGTLPSGLPPFGAPYPYGTYQRGPSVAIGGTTRALWLESTSRPHVSSLPQGQKPLPAVTLPQPRPAPLEERRMPPGFGDSPSAFTKITLGTIEGSPLMRRRQQKENEEQERYVAQLLAEADHKDSCDGVSIRREETPMGFSVPSAVHEKSSSRKRPKRSKKAVQSGERRSHASWQEYKEMQTIAPSLTTIGERNVLREFFDKGMLLRSQYRFIVNPGFNFQDWLEGRPPLVRQRIFRVLDGLWQDGRLRRKTFRSMRRDLRQFMHNEVYSGALEGDLRPGDFMRLLLRLLERKRGEHILVELEKGG